MTAPRANDPLVRRLVESGGQMAEIVSRVIREQAVVVPADLVTKCKMSLIDWDLSVLAVPQKILEHKRGGRDSESGDG